MSVRRAGWRVFPVWILGAAAIGQDSGATRMTSIEPALLAPTQGRPVFVAPGDSFHILADGASPETAMNAEIVRDRFPPLRFALTCSASDPASAAGGCTARIPVETPEGAYNLRVTIGNSVLVAPHAVAVRRVGERIRIVHLSNMNIGDIGAPEFDGRLVDEVNLVAPDLIVATGDYIDATHPAPQEAWSHLSAFLARFDAPVLMACGDHDDMAAYSRFVSPSPIGSIAVGPFRGLVLYDTPGQPAHEDAAQLAWIERTLASGAGAAGAFAVAHDESPNVLRHWRSAGTLETRLREGKLRLWISGGHRDWDGREYREIAEAAAPMIYVRTHAASAVTRDGSDGVPHFRLMELDATGARIIGPAGAPYAGSIAIGRLRARWSDPNDGSRDLVRVSVTNALPCPLIGAQVRAIVRKNGSGEPWCRGGTILQRTDHGATWECIVRFELPERGAAGIEVGCGPAPADDAIDVEIRAESAMALSTQESIDGVRFAGADDAAVAIEVSNRDLVEKSLFPLLRLDGETLAYRVVEREGPFATAYRLRLAPGETVTLKPDLSALRVRAGVRELQVYPDGVSTLSPVRRALELVIRADSAPELRQAADGSPALSAR